MAQDPVRLVADKRLEKDLQTAQTPDEIRELLHASIARSPQLGIARDEQTGQFISSRRDPLTPAAQTVEPEERVFSKTVKIGGRDFTFIDSSEDGLTNQIASAQTVAEELADEPAVATRTTRKSAVERAEDLLREQERRTELESLLRSGLITTQQFLESSGSIDEYLVRKGVDVAMIAGEQLKSGWAAATQAFLHSEAGADWPGGNRNLEMIGLQIAALNLTEAEDKVAALAQAWRAMKAKGTIFHDVSDEEMLKATENMTPQEILERFKAAHSGDPEAANQGFIDSFRGGRIGGSGIFGR